jgi:ADP-ribose pyrophosphatase
MQTWKTLSREVVWNQTMYLTVEQHTVELPNGEVISGWEWVITPDFVNVAVVTEAGAFLCFHQTKYAISGTSLAPVGGYLEPGEEPLATAQREVLEETGYAADTWINLGSYPIDGNRGSGTAHLFLAQGARRVREPAADDLEEQEILLLSRAEVAEALAQGTFKVLPWATVMLLALLRTQA